MNCKFIVGERVSIGKKTYFLHRLIADKGWQLENEIDGEFVVKPEEELLKLFREGELVFIKEPIWSFDEFNEAVEEKIKKVFSDYPEDQRYVAETRLKYVRALISVPSNMYMEKVAEIARELGEKTVPSKSTVNRWMRNFKQTSNGILGLIPQNHKSGNRTSRYSDEVIEIATNVLRRTHLSLQRDPLTTALSEIRHEIEKQNRALPAHKKLPKPGRKFLRDLVDNVDKYEKMRAQFGKAAADRHFRQAIESGEKVSNPLDRLEIDHTVLDLIVVHPKTNLPLGRPTITVALDRCSRCIVGFDVSFDPPSYVQVMRCLKHAILPKDYIRTKYPNIVHAWNCWGIPILVVVDNGKEFHSADLEAAALSLLIDIRYCPIAKPWWKGAVERFFKTINKSLIHSLPGTTFSNTNEKNTYDSLDKAAVTLDVLDELLHTWICDYYHQKPHRSTLLPPAMLWQDLIDSSRQQLPESADSLNVMLASVETRAIFHYGINLNNLTYNSNELQAIRRRNGSKKVTIRWDRSDLGQIYVLDENYGKYIEVRCTWFKYASGVSLWLHNLIRKDSMERVGEENQAKLDEAKARIREICTKAMSNKRLATRKTAARGEVGFKSGKQETAETAVELQRKAMPVVFGFDEFETDDDGEITGFAVTKHNSRDKSATSGEESGSEV